MFNNVNKLFGLLKNNKNQIKSFAFYILFGICIFATFYYGFSFQNVNDGFWHIKVGEYILKNKIIPTNDIFSWYGIQQHFKWTSHEWLFGIIAYLVYSIKGFLSVSIFVGIVNAITAVLVFIFSYRRSNNKWISLLIAYGYCINSSIIVTFRPILITIPLLLITSMLLEDKKYILALLVLIFGINVHGGTYPIYIIIFAYYTLFKNTKYLILCLIGILVNPYTYGIYLYTYKLLYNNGNANRYINEWHTTAIYDYKFCFAIIGVSLFILIFSKVKLRDLIFSSALIVLSLTSVRQVVFCYSLLLPIVSPYAVKASNTLTIRYLADFKIYNYLCNKIRIDKKAFLRIAVFIIVILVSFSTILTDINNFVENKMPIFEISNNEYPVKAVNYINNHPEIKNSHLLSDYNDSQYLIFRGVPTFVDSRQDLFTYNFNKTNVYYNYMSVFVDLSQPETLLSQYKIDYILVNENSTIYKILRNDPIVYIAYQDPYYCIFTVNKKLLSQY